MLGDEMGLSEGGAMAYGAGRKGCVRGEGLGWRLWGCWGLGKKNGDPPRPNLC